ncbi:TlyA family RNA methyltransferase [Listeria fleischmannii]|jgi:23S rRNA (cytidine1920-2'-O)/16S rRNA (cytidine1409-2'-O)-methyltransferase|uniref:TlyA family RNA methyltransferase n=1 Tax=Listeria fleischmannii TaxID=1069827 RepID=A0A841YHN8_9LIST|nr:TlyA family RNA methyltransferase [Listeria fleischmannii]MBC1399723.1 TlyA family RNA methyltransferase [Listeria fleischmannii]MBC1428033.1 TlyA family RNA methyltransferase [Listeria fleischmannii]STY34818.1 16S/23S rRNA (cytidine-2'-O)-methyltransferase TlyA [Listeria fleischmannii subsp. coloradonensis]
MSIKKERADVLLVEQGLFETREKAKRAIMAGIVFRTDTRIDKPGEKIPFDSALRVKGKTLPYVSRGGLKLEKALQVFDFDVTDKLMLDIGSSTGGFTDCALQNGARHSYALDVGYNQLAWKLRNDSRVTVMERTNFRHVTPADFTQGLADFATIDVSFISLKLILPVLRTVLVTQGDVMTLIKPQFEAGKENVGKKGIVRDPKIHLDVLHDILGEATSLGYNVLGLDFSPITGGEGNIEFIAHLKWTGDLEKQGKIIMADKAVEQIVELAHARLD